MTKVYNKFVDITYGISKALEAFNVHTHTALELPTYIVTYRFIYKIYTVNCKCCDLYANCKLLEHKFHQLTKILDYKLHKAMPI